MWFKADPARNQFSWSPDMVCLVGISKVSPERLVTLRRIGVEESPLRRPSRPIVSTVSPDPIFE